MSIPLSNVYPTYYQPYLDLVPPQDVLTALHENTHAVQDFFNRIPEEKTDHAYAHGKWTVKQVLLHLSDSERIFSYRALRIARNDPTPLPGFDENHYMTHANIEGRSLEHLLDEWQTVRMATLSLFDTLDENALQRIGYTGGQPTHVEAIGYLIAGHAIHHMKIVQERYLH